MMAAAGGRNSFFFFGKGGGGGDKRVNPVMGSSDEAELELEESDIWNSGDGTVLPDHHFLAGRRSSVSNNSGSSRGFKKPTRKPITGGISPNFAGQRGSAANMVATSLPVNIPDWSRILGEEYREHKRESEDDVDNNDDDDDDDQDDDYGRLPPHEYLARIRGSSFSVHEGAGRTLKGRDLSRVRNAVWKQTGFED